MIIEQMKIDGPKNIFLVHYNLREDIPIQVERAIKWLNTVPGYSVLSVMNGQPCPTNPLPGITLYNADNPVLKSAVEKIAKNAEPGAIIPLTAEEMDAWTNSQSTDWSQI